MLDFLCKESYDLRDFVALVSYLRSPRGCPWDQVQTHESIRRNFLEETYEACEAIDAGDLVHMREELGDVLMQVLFHTDIEREAGHFDIDDVADAACKKLVYRHPHRRVHGKRARLGRAEARHRRVDARGHGVSRHRGRGGRARVHGHGRPPQPDLQRAL